MDKVTTSQFITSSIGSNIILICHTVDLKIDLFIIYNDLEAVYF